MGLDRPFPLRLEPGQRERWEEEAAKDGASLSEFIRQRVELTVRLDPGVLKAIQAPAISRQVSGKRTYQPDPKVKPRPKAGR